MSVLNTQVASLESEKDQLLVAKEKELYVIKANLCAMEEIMQLQMKKLYTLLEAANEEIAVKVAQVKQYQKQVEAYKQQVIL